MFFAGKNNFVKFQHFRLSTLATLQNTLQHYQHYTTRNYARRFLNNVEKHETLI